MPQYAGYHPTPQNQTPAFGGHANNHPQATIHNGSHTVGLPFPSQKPAIYAPTPLAATMPPQAAHFGPQATMPNNAFPSAPQRQAVEGCAKSFPNKSIESCYNCGAPDHWAQDCPEPRRAVPAGQTNRPFKRQKTLGGTATASHQVLQRTPPTSQRGWTDPAPAQQLLSGISNRPNVQATEANEQRTRACNQFQQPRVSLKTSDGTVPSPWTQHPQPNPFAPISTGSSRQHFWNHQQYHQSGNRHVTGTNHPPWAIGAPSQHNASLSSADTSDRHTWTPQQPHLDSRTVAMSYSGEQSAVFSHNIQTDKGSASRAPPWAAQSLPTPAPSSVDSQIPSPATSSLNPIDQYTQSTPRHTESPRNRHDSVSSTNKKKDPRTQHAEMVASLFSGAALTPASKSSSPESEMIEEDTADDTADKVEDLYGLDFPEIGFEQNVTMSNPAFLVAEPLSSKNGSTETEQSVMADTSSNVTSRSKFLRDVQDEGFLKSVQESSDWETLKGDPVFAKIKANTATVTFNELIERRCHLVRAIAEAEEDGQQYDVDEDQEINQHHQETEGERLTREQEERLAALGVTGPAKPVKVSPTDVPIETPSPAATLVTRRVSGDPGWKHYENGRAVEHCSTSFESPSSITKGGRFVGSAQHPSPTDSLENARSKSPRTDGSDQQSCRKRTYSDTSEEVEIKPKRQDTEAKQRKPKYKQPKVAAAYG